MSNLELPSHAEVVKFAADIYSEEQAFLRDNQAQLNELIVEDGPDYPRLSRVDSTLQRLMTDEDSHEVKLLSKYPTPLACLTHAVWMDLIEAKDRGWSKSQSEHSIRKLRAISDIVLPPAGVVYEPEEVTLTVPAFGHDSINACQAAELYFLDAKHQVDRQEYLSQSVINVYQDETDDPILIQKHDIEASALNLKPMKVDGLYVPPASISVIGHDSSLKPSKTVKINDFTLNTYSIDDSLRLKPIRLSAWAFQEPMTRALFGLIWNNRKWQYKFEPGHYRQIENANTASFSSAARRVIELCNAKATEEA